jgi:hypothetical protein
MNAVEAAEHRLLVSVFIDAHRPDRRWLSRQDLQTEYHTDLDTRLFNSIVVDLRRDSILKTAPVNGTYAARLHGDAYKRALATILRTLDADTFEVDWQTKRIVTDAEVADKDKLIPRANGWMLLPINKTAKPVTHEAVGCDATSPIAAPIARSESSSGREGPWTKWGVIIAGLGLLVAVVGTAVAVL